MIQNCVGENMENKEAPPPYGVSAPPEPLQYPPQYPPSEQNQYPSQYPPYPQYAQPHPQNGPVHYAPPQVATQHIIAQPAATPATNVHVITTGVHPIPGACPVCHGGPFESSVTCCGICCCILFFPIGLLCLFCMTEKKCSQCGYTP